MRKHISNAIWKIFISATLNMIAYIALYAIWGALLKEVANTTASLILLSTFTSVAFALILMLFTKYRKDVGCDEFMQDYKEQPYISIGKDIKLVLQNEKITIIILSLVIAACLLLNKADTIVFGKKTISVITFPFSTMCIFSSCFPPRINFIGYFINFAVITVFYIAFVLLYRRRQYTYWNETKK